MAVEERIARVEGILEQMDKRLNHLETELASLRSEFRGEIAALRDEMNRRFEAVDRRLDSFFRWFVGLLATMWATIMAALIPILLRVLGVI